MRQRQFYLSRRGALKGASAASAFGAAAWLAACSSSKSSNSPGSAAAPSGAAQTPSTRSTAIAAAGSVTATPKIGGTLRVAMAADPTGLDPSVSRGGGDHHWLYSIFENLNNNDPKFQPAKGIADSWEVVDDLTIRFKVETGFTYHDGSQFSANDIKYTIERHQDPATKSYAAGQVASIDKVEVVDPTTVVFHLKTITASIFAIMGDRAGMILNPASVQKYGDDFTNHPVGSGPMKLDSWTPNASQKLSKFANYRKPGYPYLDGIDVEIVPNSSVQLANLRTGNTDLIFISPKDLASAKADPSIQVVDWPGISWTGANLNWSLPPLTDVRVRQALVYALNRNAILQGIYFGDGEVASGPITKASWAYNANLKPIEEDVKKAKDLLSAAGFANGVNLDFVITPDEVSTPLSEILKSQWARAGINVNLVSRDPDTAGTEYRAQKYQLFLTGFSGRADPDLTIYEEWHTGGGFNRTQFNKSYVPDADQLQLDAKIDKARQIYDQAQRKVLYDDIQQQVVMNGYGLFFTWPGNHVGLSKRVRNFTPYGDGKLRLHELWLAS